MGVERERLMREMHDGLGGQLVSTLALVQSGGALPEDVEEGLKDAIEDLRMVIDSLSPMEGDLGALLGTLRSRMERRLAQQGLSFRWEIQDLPLLTWLGPEAAVQVLRIVQEAITNVIKHARAATITVQTGRQANRLGRGGVFVAVTDDGEGFAESSAAGRGLHNMRARASRVGGELIIQPSRRGTLVKLWIPLEPSGV